MRIRCGYCEKQTASIICWADEAALCSDCDLSVHAANKLAGKHQRVSIIQQDPTLCDVCKEKSAFFFCASDRALLCRDCDVGIHAGNEFAASHTRLLVTGAAVALEALPSNNAEAPSLSGELREMPQQQQQQQKMPSHYGDNGLVKLEETRPVQVPSMLAVPSNWMTVPAAPQTPSPQMPAMGARNTNQTSSFDKAPKAVPSNMNNSLRGQVGVPVVNSALRNNMVGTNAQVPTSGGVGQLDRLNRLSSFLPEPFGVEDLLGLPNIQAGYALGDIASSKGDDGQYDWQPDFSIMDEYMMLEHNFHQVPSMSLSPPALSGGRLGRGAKGKGKPDCMVPDYDDTFVVPDLGYIHSAPSSPPLGKRQRR